MEHFYRNESNSSRTDDVLGQVFSGSFVYFSMDLCVTVLQVDRTGLAHEM